MWTQTALKSKHGGIKPSSIPSTNIPTQAKSPSLPIVISWIDCRPSVRKKKKKKKQALFSGFLLSLEDMSGAWMAEGVVFVWLCCGGEIQGWSTHTAAALQPDKVDTHTHTQGKHVGDKEIWEMQAWLVQGRSTLIIVEAAEMSSSLCQRGRKQLI